MKIAVVLFNLGGPCSKEAIEPFLMNFFTDKNIIGLPYPFRWLLAKLISKRRSKREAGESYGMLGDKSPLLENSQAQADALEKLLNKGAKDKTYKVHICMSYWHPMANEVVQNIKADAPDKIILLPLYPQFSTTTTRTSVELWDKALKKHGCTHIPSETVCCYPFNEGFIKASAEQVLPVYKKACADMKKAKHKNKPRILFSAHGLPEKIIKKGDPYQWQCEETARLIADELGVKDLDWQICYQSRVGPLKWIGPSLDEALEHAARDDVGVVVYPHAFTQEHVETLVEIDEEYREMAEEMGIEHYYKADTVGPNPTFITGLADIVKKRVTKPIGLAPDTGQRLCAKGFKQCPCMISNG